MRTLIEILVVPIPLVAGYAAFADGGWRGLLGVAAGAAVSLGLAARSLKTTGPGWRALGLSRPPRAGMTVLWCLATLVVVALIGGILHNVFLFLRVPPAPAGYPQGLNGNPVFLGLALILVWAVSLGEELLFRGFIMDRILRRLPEGKEGVQAAVVVCAVLYGLAHLPRGGQAAIVSGAAGLGYGAMYFGSGRCLWVTVAAHGVLETLAVLGSMNAPGDG